MLDYSEEMNDLTYMYYNLLRQYNLTSTLNLNANVRLGIPSSAWLFGVSPPAKSLVCWREPHIHRERAQIQSIIMYLPTRSVKA